MELLVPLLAYVGVLAGVLWVAAKSSVNAPIEPNPPRQRVKRAYTAGDRVLAETAKRHGLKHDVDVATGRVGPLRIEVAAVPDGTAPTVFRGVAHFRRALGLELEVKQRGSFGGQSGDPVVSDDFDYHFSVEALHADQARSLLAGAAGDALQRGVSRGFRIHLDDQSLEVDVDAELGPERAVEAMSWLVETAGSLVEARTGLKRPALEQRVLDAFEALAQSLGGRVEEDVLRLDLEEGELTAHVERVSGKTFRTHLELTFAKPLTVQLHLGLEEHRSRFARFRQRDIELGDETFDDTFVVLGEPVDEVKATLDEALRQKLLALFDDVDALTLTPTELAIEVNEAVADRGRLGELVDALRDVAGRLAPRRAQRAYR